MSLPEKKVYYLDGTAACYKSSIILKCREDNICYTSSSDLTEMRERFPSFYTRQDGIQFSTLPWYSMYLEKLFLDKTIGDEYTIMLCDRSPIAVFVYKLVNKKIKFDIQELKRILPAWFAFYFSKTKVLFLIDNDISAVKTRLVERGGFDVDFATDEYFVLQNSYFKAIAELYNIPLIDVNGKTFSEIYEYVVNWIK